MALSNAQAETVRMGELVDRMIVVARDALTTGSVETLKSLKLYAQSFRNEGIYYEAVTNTIRDDLVDPLLRSPVGPRPAANSSASTARPSGVMR